VASFQKCRFVLTGVAAALVWLSLANNAGAERMHKIGGGAKVTDSSINLNQLEGRWVYHRPGTGGMVEASAVAWSKEGHLLISVELHGAVIKTITVRPDAGVLKGTANLDPAGSHEVDVEIYIEKGGARMVAVPAGFRNLERWYFERP